MKILEKEYMDETLTLQSVSERLHVSPNYLGANLKKARGRHVYEHPDQKADGRGAEPHAERAEPDRGVARRCGYSEQSYFGYCFKKYYGMSPARMRQTAAEHGETAQ